MRKEWRSSINRTSLFLVVISLAWACAGDGGPVTLLQNDTGVQDKDAAGGDEIACTPQCDGRECGDDGCGGTCGACPLIAPVCLEGACVLGCTPACEEKECGDDGCGGDCGTCDDGLSCTIDSCTNGICDSLTQAFFCLLDGACVPSGTVDPGNPCQACQPGIAQDGWSPLEDDTPCGGKKVCFQGECCDPEAGCEEIECGDDGCGGSCGECPEEYSCDAGICVPDCLPSCEGKACGDDGCGGSCGECDAGYACDEGDGTATCVAECAALCAGLECGPAGDENECDCGICDDGDVCTDDACAVTGLCQFTFNEEPCDDGNPCTGDDICDQGTCSGAVLPIEELLELDCICEDDEDCLSIENGDVCDGTLVCEASGGIGPGVCEVDPMTIPICDDVNPCTDDSCDPVAGCEFDPDDTNVCADADPCDGVETCVSSVCLPGQALVCDDFNPCTDDGCVTLQGCVFEPDDTNDCADANVCNGVELCSGGQCDAGIPLDCGDGDKCTADSCDPLAGCGYAPAVGVCDDALDCTMDSCQDDVCSNTLQPYYCLLGGTCVPSGAEDPDNPCQKCAPNLATTAWTYLGDGMPCAAGKVCYQGVCCDHATNCSAKECGDDGCGGDCGTCPVDWSCQGGLCVEGPCAPDCDGKECGPDGCDDVCGTCPLNHFCTLEGLCFCLPSCDGKQCGDNGCGGDCGVCSAGWSCQDELCIEDPCEPDCDGKECGPDGCGEFCGTCPENHFCSFEGTCFCIPDCDGKQCGDNGCGGDCGVCSASWSCQEGLCVEEPCEPDCDGKECGDDGCEGSCGDCDPGWTCLNDVCVEIGSEDTCVGHCGGAAGTCYCDELCFALGTCCVDICEACPDLDGCTCGDNECQTDLGEDCSTCPADCSCECGEECVDGTCVSILCEGKECGDDGCGGTCGECEVPDAPCVTGVFCVEGSCVVEVQSFYCLVEGVCVPSGTENPENPCLKCQPGVTQIGWSAIDDGTPCGDGVACHGGVCCDYDCDGKQCGPDGCGGTCGECIEGIACSEAGLCNGCEDGNDVDWDGCTGGEITEFQVNGYWTGSQGNPDIAVLENDGFAVVWEYQAGGDAGTDVHVRVFDPEGTPLGIETLVPASVLGSQTRSRIVALPDGGFIVLWQQPAEGTYKNDILAQRYLASGEKDGEAFVASPDSSADDRYPEAALLDNGELMVIWSVDTHIYGRRMALDGTPLGIQIDIAQASSTTCSLLPIPGGGFFVTFLQKVGGYSGKHKVHGRWFDEHGVAQGDSFLLEAQGEDVHQNNPRAALLSDTEILVAWAAYYNVDGSGQAVYAQRLTPGGGNIGDLFLVNTTTQSDQKAPHPVALPDGKFAIAWYGNGPGDTYGAFMQRFDADAIKLGDETRVNSYTDNTQYPYSVDTFSDGSFMVVMQSEVQDGNSKGIFAQRFNADGHKLYR